MFRSKSSKYACLLLITSLVGLSLSLAGCHRWHSGGSNGNNQGRGTDGNQQETSPEAYVLSGRGSYEPLTYALYVDKSDNAVEVGSRDAASGRTVQCC